MQISEDQTVYLDDFGVSCTSGGTTAKAILEQPDLVLAGNQIISTDYQLTARIYMQYIYQFSFHVILVV